MAVTGFSVKIISVPDLDDTNPHESSLMRSTELTNCTNTRRRGTLRRIDAGYLLSWTAVFDFVEGIFPGCEKEATGGREVIRVGGQVLAYLASNERSRPSGVPENEEFVIVRMPDENACWSRILGCFS
jgi:hypothetical protein